MKEANWEGFDCSQGALLSYFWVLVSFCTRLDLQKDNLLPRKSINIEDTTGTNYIASFSVSYVQLNPWFYLIFICKISDQSDYDTKHCGLV